MSANDEMFPVIIIIVSFLFNERAVYSLARDWGANTMYMYRSHINAVSFMISLAEV